MGLGTGTAQGAGFLLGPRFHAGRAATADLPGHRLSAKPDRVCPGGGGTQLVPRKCRWSEWQNVNTLRTAYP